MGDARLSFQRSARLLTKADYDYVFAQPRKFSDRYFTVLARHNPAGGGARLGLAVSKKVAKSAVLRNAIKRQVRETFRQRRRRLDRLDVVVIARAPAGERPLGNTALAESLTRHWARLERSCVPD